MPTNTYYMIRMNFKSILILCKDCHQSYHGKNDKGEDIYFISQERIEKVLKEYYEKTEETK
jgi:predicted metal-binding protein